MLTYRLNLNFWFAICITLGDERLEVSGGIERLSRGRVGEEPVPILHDGHHVVLKKGWTSESSEGRPRGKQERASR
jgi:hypothetical protein